MKYIINCQISIPSLEPKSKCVSTQPLGPLAALLTGHPSTCALWVQESLWKNLEKQMPVSFWHRIQPLCKIANLSQSHLPCFLPLEEWTFPLLTAQAGHEHIIGWNNTQLHRIRWFHWDICCNTSFVLQGNFLWLSYVLCVSFHSFPDIRSLSILVAWYHGVSRTDQVPECLHIIFYMLRGNRAWHKRESELLIGFTAITPRAALCPQ